MSMNQSSQVQIGFAQYDGERVSVVVDSAADIALTGIACFQRDDRLGNILRVSPESEEPGDPAIILTELKWRGRVVSGSRHGTKYCFVPRD